MPAEDMVLDRHTAAVVGTAGDNPFSFPTHTLLNTQGALNGALWPFNAAYERCFLWLDTIRLKFFQTISDPGVTSLLDVLNDYRKRLKSIFDGLLSLFIETPRRKAKHLRNCLKAERSMLTRCSLTLSRLQLD